MRIRVLCAVALIVLTSNALVQAELASWDAYAEFNSASNDSANIWSYYSVAEGSNDGYGLLGVYGTFPYQSYNGWNASQDNFPSIGASGGEMKAQADINIAAAIGWKSPINGVVDASFSLHDDDYGAKGAGDWSEVPYDGVSYALFKGGDAAALASGYVANGGDSGTVTVDSISVTAGDMLYLQIGDGSYNNWYDTTGFSFTVSEVPEPSTMVLLACGLVSILSYAWRKQR